MVDIRTGSQTGITRNATIRKYNGDGTVVVAIDEAGFVQPKQEYSIPIPAAWVGPGGQFLGGLPAPGASVKVVQGQGGEWFGIGYKTNSQDFTAIADYSAFKAGRILGQVKGGNRFFLDPNIGFQVGNEKQFIHADPIRSILSNKFEAEWNFLNSNRSIYSSIKRDISDGNSRSLVSSFLNSHEYDDGLFTVGMDSSLGTSPSTVGSNVRNVPLVESKEVVYEFQEGFGFNSYSEESERYKDPSILPKKVRNSRRDNRTDAFALSLEYPNHLMETIKGTGVDIFGNILDLNRYPLPIGKLDSLSLKNDPDKSEAFKNILGQLRKSLAFHFEINARKEFESNDLTPPNVNSSLDFARNRSRFFVDVDKEGVFKWNVPSSSEVGNIPLLARYENYSVLASKENEKINPNEFIRPENYQDIYLDSFAGQPRIKLAGSDEDFDGYYAPVDRMTDSLFKMGTAFHDITRTCSEFQTSADYLKAGLKLINYDPNNILNTLTPFSKIVSDTIIVNGPNANGGGRSGMMNFDGMVMANFGANTIDRQSLWLDFAGGVVSNIGRDKSGISYALNADGDILIQIGGEGLPEDQDSRFADQNASYRNGTLDIRVLNNGQVSVVRIGPEGIEISSVGGLSFSAEQDITFKTNSNILLDAESVIVYPSQKSNGQPAGRAFNRMPAGKTIG